MATVDLSFGGVSVPANTSASVTIEEDVGATGAFNNSDTISLSDATTSYTSANTFDASSGNKYRLVYDVSNSDVEQTAEITHPATLSVPLSTAGSVVVTDSSGVVQTSNGVRDTQ